MPADTAIVDNVLSSNVPSGNVLPSNGPTNNVLAASVPIDTAPTNDATLDPAPAVNSLPSYGLPGSEQQNATPSEDPEKRTSRKRKNTLSLPEDAVPGVHNAGSEEPPVPKKRVKKSQHQQRGQKDAKNVGGNKDDSQHPGRMSAARLEEIAGKVIARIETKRTSRTPSSDMEHDEVDMPDDNVPLGHQCAIPGLTMSEYTELEKEAKAQLSDFALTGKPEMIEKSIRLFIITFQGFLGLTSFQTRQLGLVVHDTGEKGTCCRYHAKFKTGTIYDQVGYPLVGGSAVQTGQKAVQATGDTMDCGCPVDDVLFEFFFWKTWTARSAKPGDQIFEESMRGIIISPRLRTFICQAFSRYTRLSVADVYNWSKSGTTFMIYTAVMQVQRLVKELGEGGIKVDVQDEKVRWSMKGNTSGGGGGGGGGA